MLYSVPTQDGGTIFNTPLNAKSLRGFYFEMKQTGSTKLSNYLFQKTLSINVGGREIFRKLSIAPFCTRIITKNSSTNIYEIGKYSWQPSQMYIPTAINVNNTEIKISDFMKNLFNIVFIFDTNPVEKENFLFFEQKDIILRPNERITSKQYNFSFDYAPQRLFALVYLTNGIWIYEFLLDFKKFCKANFNVISDNSWFDNDLNFALMSVTSNSWKEVIIEPHKDVVLKKNLVFNLDNFENTYADILHINLFFSYNKI